MLPEQVPKVEFKIIATTETEKPSEHVAQVLTIPTFKFGLHQDQVDTLAEHCELEDDSCKLYVIADTIPHRELKRLATRK